MPNHSSSVNMLYFWYNGGSVMSCCDSKDFDSYSRNRLPPDFSVVVPSRATDEQVAQFVALQQKVYTERMNTFDPEYAAPAFFFGVFPQKRTGKGIEP